MAKSRIRVKQQQNHPERWLLGGFLSLLSVIALFLSAYAQEGGFYIHGLVLFALCTGWVFNLIRLTFDDKEHHE
jgi:hypothetical protein